jgi:transcriptional repressor NrdR
MKCQHCRISDTKVIESRDVAEGESIRRRRECAGCGYRFTTYERVERPHLVVVKNNGTRETFSREKLQSGIQRACDKTSVTNMQLEQLLADIERQLYARGEPEVSTIRIGEMVMRGLSGMDEVAYVRFASVYRRFKDIESFEKELSEFRAQKHAN